MQSRPYSVKPGPRPTAPPPRAPATGFSSLLLRVAAVAGLALVSVAVGAFALPGGRKAPAVAPVEAPVVETVTEVESKPAADTRRVEPPSPQPRPATFDRPMVAPRLPAGPDYDLARGIGRAIQERLDESKTPASPLAGDAEFLRRAHLDLLGRVPTRERTVAFLEDADPEKRAKLIEELLADPGYGQHFARLWADVLIKRDFDNNKNLRPERFSAWLAGRFNSNAPWDETVRQMINAGGSEEEVPQTFFVLANQDNRQPSPSKLTAAVGNLFMGIQIHCAECHQHPFTSGWGMNDFWGLAAFFGHTRANRPAPANGKRQTGPATIAEIEATAVPRNRKGLPKQKQKQKMGPVIRPGLVINIPDPNDPRKVVRTARGKFFESNRPVPAGPAPYRPRLAAWLTSRENRYFAQAAVNRMWAHFFARGLVHPIEDMNPQNKASHPALLRELSEALVSSRYDLKHLVRAICNSEPYQRTSRPLPDNQNDERLYSHMSIKVMEAQVLLDSLAVATGQRGDRPALGPRAARSPQGTGGNPLVRFFDTREVDDDPTEFSYGIPQLLRLMNTRLSAASSNIAAKLVRQHNGDADRVLEDLYLTALSRRPSPREKERLKTYVARHKDPTQAYAGVLWALLNCAEFVSNH